MSNLDGPPYYDSGLGDVPVPAAVAPLGLPPVGSFGSMRTSCVVGGAKMVDSLVSRDAIPAGLRAEGMTCFVQATGLTYQLQGGILNANWVTFGGGTLQTVMDAGSTASVAAAVSIESTAANVEVVAGPASQLTLQGGDVVVTSVDTGGVLVEATLGTSDITLDARGQTATYNDVANTSFTGAATGATSLVGAINLAAAASGGTWAAVLTGGASTGTTNPVLTNSQRFVGETIAGTGGTLALGGGLATLAAGTGGPITMSTAVAAAGTTYVERMRVSAIGTTFLGDGTLISNAAYGGPGLATTSINAYRNDVNTFVMSSFSATAGSAGVHSFIRARGTAAAPTIVSSGDTLGTILFSGGGSSTAIASAASIGCLVDGTPGAATDMPGRLVFSTTPDGSGTLTERVRIAQGGSFQLGDGTLGASNPAQNRNFVLYRNGNTQFVMGCFDASAGNSTQAIFYRGRGTAATPVIVQNNDLISNIGFYCAQDATSFAQCAAIDVYVDGTPGATNDMPGRMIFSTTPDGSSTSVERLRITNLGTSFFGDGTLTAALGGSPGATSTSISAYRNETNAVRFSAFSAASAATAPYLVFTRGRGTAAVPAIVTSGDAVGGISFVGIESSGGSQECASIAAAIDGTPGVGDMPGRIVFSTTPDGSGSAGILERMRINNAGLVFLGNGTLASTAPAQRQLTLYANGTAQFSTMCFDAAAGNSAQHNFVRGRGTAAAPTIVAADDLIGSLVFLGIASATVASGAASIECYVDGTPGAVNDMPGRLIFGTTPDGSGTVTERVRINNVGTTFFGDGTLAAAVFGAGASTTSMVSYRNETNVFRLYAFTAASAASAPGLVLGRGRGTAAAPTIVSSGDTLGSVSFTGVQGASGAVEAARIECLVDGTPGAASDMPGRLVFSTSPDGSATVVERLRIDNAGVVYVGNGATAASPNAGTIRATGGSGSGVAGALLTITGGPPGSGNANGGGLTLQAQPASGSGTNGELSLIARSQTVTLNDASNSAFTGSATGATSLVGAINAVGGTGTGALRSLGQSRGTGATRTLAVLPATLITAVGDRIELSGRGDLLDAAGTLTAGLGATTLFTSTAVAPGAAAWTATLVIVRVTDTTADWYATLYVEGSVVYAGGATAATVPSLTAGASNAPFFTVTGATSTALNLVGTAVKA